MMSYVEYKEMRTVDGQRYMIPYRVVEEDDFVYVSIQQFREMTDSQRVKYINDLHLYEMRYQDATDQGEARRIW